MKKNPKKKSPRKTNVKVKKEAVTVVKEEEVETHPVAVTKFFTPDMFFKIFYEGWINCFKLTGRTSRVELWAFLLVNAVISSIIQLKCNYILSPNFLIEANTKGFSIDKIDTYVAWAELLLWGSILLPLIPIFSMLVRRMHDLDRLAWHGYIEQVFMGVVVLSMLIIGIDELKYTSLEYTLLAMFVCFITILYSVLYYGFKFLIVTLFYKGNEKKNRFGEPKFKSAYDDELALKLTIFYILFVLTIGLLYWGVWYF